MNLLLIGNRRRTTEATNANQTSSRSHAVFQITVIINILIDSQKKQN